MMTEKEKKEVFSILRSQPNLGWKDLAQVTGIPSVKILLTVGTDKDFRVTINSIKDLREGRINS